MKTVVLIGFPGAGKTSVGKALSEKFGWRLVDVDEEVERQAGCSITRLIRAEGEAHFRKVEREAIVAALAAGAQVIAVGGGALLNEDTRRDFAEKCFVVGLKISAAGAAARIEADEKAAQAAGGEAKRPLLSDEAASGSMLERVEKLMEKRRHLYKSADAEVETEGRRPEEIAGEIVRLVEAASGK